MLRHILKKLSTAFRKPRIEQYQLLLVADGRIIGGAAIDHRNVRCVLTTDPDGVFSLTEPVTIEVHRSGDPRLFLGMGTLLFPLGSVSSIPHVRAGDTVTVY